MDSGQIRFVTQFINHMYSQQGRRTLRSTLATQGLPSVTSEQLCGLRMEASFVVSRGCSTPWFRRARLDDSVDWQRTETTPRGKVGDQG